MVAPDPAEAPARIAAEAAERFTVCIAGSMAAGAARVKRSPRRFWRRSLAHSGSPKRPRSPRPRPSTGPAAGLAARQRPNRLARASRDKVEPHLDLDPPAVGRRRQRRRPAPPRAGRRSRPCRTSTHPRRRARPAPPRPPAPAAAPRPPRRRRARSRAAAGSRASAAPRPGGRSASTGRAGRSPRGTTRTRRRSRERHLPQDRPALVAQLDLALPHAQARALAAPAPV